jgi:hypothetical protein
VRRLTNTPKVYRPQFTSVAFRLRWWRRLACVLAVLTLFSLPLSLGAAPGDEVKGLAQRVRALERKLQHVTMEVGVDNLLPELVITGANLRIVNGLKITDTVNGLGNLIVGYNELRAPYLPATNRAVLYGHADGFAQRGGRAVSQFLQLRRVSRWPG